MKFLLQLDTKNGKVFFFKVLSFSKDAGSHLSAICFGAIFDKSLCFYGKMQEKEIVKAFLFLWSDLSHVA